MLVDAGALSDDAVLSAHVCVVGAGPAGITVASELEGAGFDVVVLEAGKLPYDRARMASVPKSIFDHIGGAQSLARGLNAGEPYFPLRLSRARGIGGSTNALKSHGLRSRPLDAIDFENRFGVGWPIEHAEFAAHVPAAARYCGIDGSFDREDLSVVGTGIEKVEGVNVVTFRAGPRDAFTRRVDQFRASERVRYVTSAVATEFDLDDSGSVSAVGARALRGGRFRVRARMVVLAAGGVDNPRLLLSSPPLLEAMGPAADLVGRFFMEHLHPVLGHLIPASPDVAERLLSFFGSPDAHERMLALSDDLVREHGLRRVVFAGTPVYTESLDPAVRAAGSLRKLVPYGPYALRPRLQQGRTAATGIPHIVGAAAARLRSSRSKDVFVLAAMAEQAPSRDSRVTLSARRDRTGLPLPVLTWRVSDGDFEALRLSTDLLARELSATGIGEVVSSWGAARSRPPVIGGGWHHMGTTRMSASAEHGVVDGDCRVHGISNLYVAGSSVFPTGGFANPTLSLVALAVRLGGHLARKLS